MKQKILIFILLFLTSFQLHSSTGLEKAELKRERLLARVNAIKNNPKKLAETKVIAKRRALLCSKCHGLDGNSNNKEIPILASQNALYLLDQIERFATKKRVHFVMNALAKSLSDDERTMLAVYYSSNKIISSKGDKEKAKKAKVYYQTICINCHGADGKGEKGYARIAGQRPDFIIKTLKDFRSHKKDRKNKFMETFTNTLSDEQIENLAAYIANLR